MVLYLISHEWQKIRDRKCVTIHEYQQILVLGIFAKASNQIIEFFSVSRDEEISTEFFQKAKLRFVVGGKVIEVRVFFGWCRDARVDSEFIFQVFS